MHGSTRPWVEEYRSTLPRGTRAYGTFCSFFLSSLLLSLHCLPSFFSREETQLKYSDAPLSEGKRKGEKEAEGYHSPPEGSVHVF